MNDVAMAPRYDAAQTEAKWYAAWESAGLFTPDEDTSRESYCITIPPPNITGSLHMGHALCYPLQDAVGRFQRLLGKNVLVLPGQDHAGIATQSVVEKQLRKEGLSGAKIGRDAFIERVWNWRAESGDEILRGFRAFGCAFDWSRSRFTLDERYVEAVLKVFIDWFDRGLIFRGKRVVNWDPVLKTSVSDIETERKTTNGKLYYIRYPYEDGSGYVVVATTRPETMLGDVAVAVHPSDPRYNGKIGKALLLPLLNRPIPLIADIYPDPSFGSGAVKITPAHDPNDYQVGTRHQLDMPVVLNENAKINELGGPYAGLDRYEARKKILADLESAGLLDKVEPHEIPILVSERSGEVIEPLLSEQWFVDQPKLAEPAMQAVRNGKIRFTPDRYNRIYLDWMENIREWCISRQLWWGHRIPVYFGESGKAYAALNWDLAQEKAGEDRILRQDDDVLDTWFSSGLWPFATLGWPEKTADLERYYPTQILITDRNIINLWVARMAMMGLDFMNEVPFADVFIYATVLTEDGRRMSKSLGTGVDPTAVIEKIGADALRWTLQSQTGENQDIRYSERRTEEARNLCNKLWNATRFVLMNLDAGMPDRPIELNKIDRWLLSRLAKTEATVHKAYQTFQFQEACQALQSFFWYELCDWYIEVSKSRLADPAQKATPQWVLLTAIEALCILFHPVMPHITEELYSHLPIPGKAPFVMVAQWPQNLGEFIDESTETEIERVFAITRAARALRAELGLSAMKSIPEAYADGNLGESATILKSQAWIETLHLTKPDPTVRCVSTSVAGVDLFVPIGGNIDAEREFERLINEAAKIEAELAKLQSRLENPDFVQRAKPEIVERERAAAEDLQSRLAKNQERQRLFQDS